ncbi:DUF6232 family protein [Actinoplanes sp. N902-109]|uniref:DUF6232 family protein n=1 Tax=Actinoplanes sp. (strain N902-109) TaxID=649831 RepID=UPI00032955FE|nr:DUF6232 family protein [Actinoplanes sp. N902-109]AGL15236.1 hypothetical protein L083_1726 [Actinoplanes sp. N902-109]
MALNSSTAVPGHSGWAVYYDGPAVVVTSWYVMNTEGRYPVAHLTNVRQVHIRSYTARLAAVFAGAVEVMLAMPLAIGYGSVVLLGAGAVAAAGIMTATAIDGRRNPRWMSLWATLHGRDVELFSSPDKREFERVRRAVIRAVQLNRDPWP